jgi:hypothetical protein
MLSCVFTHNCHVWLHNLVISYVFTSKVLYVIMCIHTWTHMIWLDCVITHDSYVWIHITYKTLLVNTYDMTRLCNHTWQLCVNTYDNIWLHNLVISYVFTSKILYVIICIHTWLSCVITQSSHIWNFTCEHMIWLGCVITHDSYVWIHMITYKTLLVNTYDMIIQWCFLCHIVGSRELKAV